MGTRLQRDMQKIRLILIDEILNRQDEACVTVAPADVGDRSLFDEMAEVQCTDLVAGRSHHVIVLLHDELQLTILRQHRDHIAGCLLSHILKIGMHRIHEVIAARNIGHRQARLFHRGVHRILPLHRVPGTVKIEDECDQKYRTHRQAFFQFFSCLFFHCCFSFSL